MAPPKRAGLWNYLKEAFAVKWNIVAFLGAAGAAALSPIPDILLPLVTAAELTYLSMLTASTRFRAAIDAKIHKGHGVDPAQRRESAGQNLTSLLRGLTDGARHRFEALQRRCIDMRRIAQGVGGRTANPDSAVDRLDTPGLDRLLWIFLRLLYSRQSLTHFLETTDERKLDQNVKTARARLEKATERGDERKVRSLRDSLATAELRLDNYKKADDNAEFVEIELERIEGKINAISEMSINRQDPDFISKEVDSVAESMRHTEAAISELKLVTGLVDDLAEPPAILEVDLDRAMRDEA
jgi:hypothetical protein